MRARVNIYDAAYDDSLERVVERVLDELPARWQGKRVLVKPNILAPHLPEAGVTTHPVLVRAVCRSLRQRGATVTVGDSPGMAGYGGAEEAARRSGVLEAAEGAYVNLARDPVRVELPLSELGGVLFSRDVLEADLVVNLPKLKTHGLTIMTGAVKNTFGHVLGGDKMRVHAAATTPRKFAEALLDIYEIRPPELNIMDAVVAMQGNGPSKGTLRTLGKVLASADAVALDTVAVHLIGQTVSAVPLLALAGRRGLGETDLSRIEIRGDLTQAKDFKLPATFVPGLVGVVLNRFLARWVNCVPTVVQSACEACEVCVDHCPVDAMSLSDGFPIADLDQCISCYCCQELCPSGAIELTGRVMQTLRRLYG